MDEPVVILADGFLLPVRRGTWRELPNGSVLWPRLFTAEG
jgi:hypothetical protein